VTISEKNASNTKAGWHYSEYAKQYYERERSFLDASLRQSVGPCALQIGHLLDQSVLKDLELPYLLKADFKLNDKADIYLDPAFLPFAPGEFSTVILPHVLETQGLHHQLLREAHRVLQNEGHLILTGFNPYSLVGLQRFIRPKAVCSGRYYSLKRVIDWLQLLGFEVVVSSVFQYAPLSKSRGVRRTFEFLEAIAHHCLPMIGGGYMITAKKREVGLTKLGRLANKKRRSKLIPVNASKTSMTSINSTDEP